MSAQETARRQLEHTNLAEQVRESPRTKLGASRRSACLLPPWVLIPFFP